jgi:hypothetical protein
VTSIQTSTRTASGPPQSRDLVRIAFGPALMALIVIAAITLVQLVVANSDLTGTLGAVASEWLAVHLVPITIGGQQLGVLPLAPAALMVWATARGTAQVTSPAASVLVVRVIVGAAVGGPLFIAAIALAVIHDAASVITALQTPNALRAFGGVLAIHGLGALIGVGSRVGPRVMSRLGLPGWLTDTVRPAMIGVLTLLALSCAVVTASLVVHWGTMHELFGITDSFFGQLSLMLLSLLYLPNLMVGAAAVAVGSSAHIGFATFSAFTVFGGDIPALPILAAVPTPPLGPVWVALLIVGAASGVALGQQCALKPLPVVTAFAKVAVAALLASISLALLGVAGGGLLGNFGNVGVDQVTFAPGAFFWFFSIGALTVAMAGGISGARAPAALDDERAHAVGRPDGGRAAAGGVDDESGPEGLFGEDEVAAGSEAADAESDAESELEPSPPPPPVTAVPDAEDVEDLMFVDDDIADGTEGDDGLADGTEGDEGPADGTEGDDGPATGAVDSPQG